MKLIQWFQQREDRQMLKYAFQLTRATMPKVHGETRCLLLCSMRQLLREYNETWGAQDGVAAFYNDELHRLIVINQEVC